MKQLFYAFIFSCLFVTCTIDKLDDVELKVNEFENPALPFVTVDQAVAINNSILMIDVTVHQDRFPSSIDDSLIAIITPLGGTVITEKRRNIFIGKLESGISKYEIGLFERETEQISATSTFTFP